MAYWAAIRNSRHLPPQKLCANPGCGKKIRACNKYCWLCAISGGQRRIRP